MSEAKTGKLLRALLCTALGGMVIFGTMAGAKAEDDDDETFEQRMIKNVLSGLGVDIGRASIDYRERSPLVVPPSRDLPPPDTASTIQDPAWPKDPDRKEHKKTTKTDRRSKRVADYGPDDPGRALRPDELSGRKAGGGEVTAPGPTDRDYGRVLRPSELGYTGGLFGSLFGHKEEVATFKGEPPRASLVEPPSGYRTPSAAQPYGVGQKAFKPSAYNLENRGLEKER